MTRRTLRDLEDHTYYAAIRIKKDGELIDVDSRPSDAVALAVHYSPHLPIYVADEVRDDGSFQKRLVCSTKQDPTGFTPVVHGFLH